MGVSNLNNFFLLLHIGCALLGFGGLAYNGIYLLHAHHQSPAARAAIIEANRDVSRVAEVLVYAVFVLGLAVVSTSKSVVSFSDTWLSAAMALYLVDIGFLHGFIRRMQKQYNGLIEQVNSSARRVGTAAPAEVTDLDRLEQRISFAWIAFDVVFLVVVYLMVFKP
jgi:uncharacterized membrane protein